MGLSKSISKREVYSNTVLPHERKKKSQINNLNLHLQQLEKKEKKQNLKLIEGKKSNEIDTKKTIAKISETKSLFFEKINKIDKPLAKLIKKKRERTQINKI